MFPPLFRPLRSVRTRPPDIEKRQDISRLARPRTPAREEPAGGSKAHPVASRTQACAVGVISGRRVDQERFRAPQHRLMAVRGSQAHCTRLSILSPSGTLLTSSLPEETAAASAAWGACACLARAGNPAHSHQPQEIALEGRFSPAAIPAGQLDGLLRSARPLEAGV